MSTQLHHCTECAFVTDSSRKLGRHLAIAHATRKYRCPLCPFVSCYGANLYRHKRDVHGIGRNTQCEHCPFESINSAAMLLHKQTEHPEEYNLQIEIAKLRYQNELEQMSLSTVKYSQMPDNSNIPVEETPSVSMAQGIQNCDADNSGSLKTRKVRKRKFPLYPSEETDDLSEPMPSSMLQDLMPCRIQRTYRCDPCNLATRNPRDYLYHLRDVHGEKLKVFECSHCLYASRHQQKLQRHFSYCHAPKIKVPKHPRREPVAKKSMKASSTNSVPTVASNYNVIAIDSQESIVLNNSMNHSALSNEPSNINTLANEEIIEDQFSDKLDLAQELNSCKVKMVPDVEYKCSVCHFKSKSKILVQRHEKVAHLKKKFFRCVKCNYVTHIRARYTKHIKYHSLPDIKCDMCDFKSPYKWNLDRHLKSHNVEGVFQCSMCNFAAQSKQSLTVHVTNHHEPQPEESPNDTLELNPPLIIPEMKSDSIKPDISIFPIMSDSHYEVPPQPEVLLGDSLEVTEILPDNVGYDHLQDAEDPAEYVMKHGRYYKKILKCRYCMYRTAWPSDLRYHENKHKKNVPLISCPICGQGFTEEVWLRRHMKQRHHKVLKTSGRKFLKKTPNNVEISVELSQSNQSASKEQLLKCDLCSYEAKWVSELLKHKRVHTQEKPFTCPLCGYRSKWKGDLTRHVQKYHRNFEFADIVSEVVPKYVRRKKPLTLQARRPYVKRARQEINNELLQVGKELTYVPELKAESEASTSSIPLDLTIHKNELLSGNNSIELIEIKQENYCEMPQNSSEIETGETNLNHQRPEAAEERMAAVSKDIFSKRMALPIARSRFRRKRYQCPKCTYTSSTASRFHVHMVSHLNQRPFMCSECGYRSNWQWDVTKHIKIKTTRDLTHTNASLVILGDVGDRNYEKYDKYIQYDPKPLKPAGEPSSIYNSSDMLQNISKLVNQFQPDNGSEFQMESGSQFPTDNEVQFQQENTNQFLTDDGNKFQGTSENHLMPVSRNIARPVKRARSGRAPRLSKGLKNQFLAEDVNMPYTGIKRIIFKCKKCTFKSPSKKVMHRHMVTHSTDRPYLCGHCGQASRWRHVIERHCRFKHNNIVSVIEPKGDLPQQLQNDTEFLFTQNSENVETEDKQEFTPESGYEETSEYQEDETTADSSSEPRRKHECNICPYACKKLFDMRIHMKQHQPQPGAIFKCMFCPYYTSLRRSLFQHMKLHVNEPQEYISKALESSQDQEPEFAPPVNKTSRKHYSVEKMVQKLNESEPPKSKVTVGEGEAMMFVSVQMKRYSCDHCPYSSNSKTQYLYHKQFHRSSKVCPHKCPICNYAVSKPHLLQQHIRLHSQNSENSEVIEKLEAASSLEDSISQKSPVPIPLVEHQQPDTAAEHCNELASKQNTIPVIFVSKGAHSFRMYKCRFCPHMNRRRSNIKVHEKMHRKRKVLGKFACTYCSYACNNQGVLSTHLKVHQNTSDYQVLSNSEEVQKDNILQTPEKEREPFVKILHFCDLCPARFPKLEGLQTHNSFHGSSFPWKCSMCNYAARHRPHLHNHFKVHSPEYQSKTDEMLQRISNRKELSSPNAKPSQSVLHNIVHKVVHSFPRNASPRKNSSPSKSEGAVKKHKCHICPAKFLKTSSLAYHLTLHEGKGRFKCQYCTYSVKNLGNLVRHVKIHGQEDNSALYNDPEAENIILAEDTHVVKNRKVYCTKCPAVFGKISRFAVHERLHGSKQRFTCQYCDYSVKFLTNLLTHEKVHEKAAENGIDPHILNMSPSKVSIVSSPPEPSLSEQQLIMLQQHQLQMQQQQQYGEDAKKLFYCDRCPYHNSRKDAVMSHLKRHTLEQGPNCPYCDYSTTLHSFLRDHTKLHFQPPKRKRVEMFMKCENMEIWALGSGGDTVLLFQDRRGLKSEGEPNFVAPFMSDDEDIGDIEECQPSEIINEELNSAKETNMTATENNENELDLNDDSKKEAAVKLLDTDSKLEISTDPLTVKVSEDMIDEKLLDTSNVKFEKLEERLPVKVIDDKKPLEEFDDKINDRDVSKNVSSVNATEESEEPTDVKEELLDTKAHEISEGILDTIAHEISEGTLDDKAHEASEGTMDTKVHEASEGTLDTKAHEALEHSLDISESIVDEKVHETSEDLVSSKTHGTSEGILDTEIHETSEDLVATTAHGTSEGIIDIEIHETPTELLDTKIHELSEEFTKVDELPEVFVDNKVQGTSEDLLDTKINEISEDLLVAVVPENGELAVVESNIELMGIVKENLRPETNKEPSEELKEIVETNHNSIAYLNNNDSFEVAVENASTPDSSCAELHLSSNDELNITKDDDLQNSTSIDENKAEILPLKFENNDSIEPISVKSNDNSKDSSSFVSEENLKFDSEVDNVSNCKLDLLTEDDVGMLEITVPDSIISSDDIPINKIETVEHTSISVIDIKNNELINSELCEYGETNDNNDENNKLMEEDFHDVIAEEVEIQASETASMVSEECCEIDLNIPDDNHLRIDISIPEGVQNHENGKVT